MRLSRPVFFLTSNSTMHASTEDIYLETTKSSLAAVASESPACAVVICGVRSDLCRPIVRRLLTGTSLHVPIDGATDTSSPLCFLCPPVSVATAAGMHQISISATHVNVTSMLVPFDASNCHMAVSDISTFSSILPALVAFASPILVWVAGSIPDKSAARHSRQSVLAPLCLLLRAREAIRSLSGAPIGKPTVLVLCRDATTDDVELSASLTLPEPVSATSHRSLVEAALERNALRASLRNLAASVNVVSLPQDDSGSAVAVQRVLRLVLWNIEHSPESMQSALSTLAALPQMSRLQPLPVGIPRVRPDSGAGVPEHRLRFAAADGVAAVKDRLTRGLDRRLAAAAREAAGAVVASPSVRDDELAPETIAAQVRSLCFRTDMSSGVSPAVLAEVEALFEAEVVKAIVEASEQEAALTCAVRKRAAATAAVKAVDAVIAALATVQSRRIDWE